MPEPKDIEGDPVHHGDEVLGRFTVTGQHGDVLSLRPVDEKHGRELPNVLIESRLVKKVRGGQPPPFNE